MKALSEMNSPEVLTSELVKADTERSLLRKLIDKVPFAVWLIVPVECFLLFLLIVPSLISIWLSFVDWQPTFGIPIYEAPFVGFENFIELFSDKRFIMALLRTFFVTGVAVSAEFLIGLGLAVLCEKEFPMRKFFVLCLLMPMMLVPLVVGNNFYLLFQPMGPINDIISRIIGSNFKFDWLASPDFAIIPILLSEIWHWYPLMFLIMLSGLRAMPPNQLRAADVLGSSKLQTFFRIKIPQLVPVILIAIVIRCMEVFKMFDEVSILTKGGPGTVTETISFYMYKIGLKDFRFSYVSAGAWIVLIVCVIIFSLLLKPLLYKVEKFEEGGKDS
jgi:multiple sugar transport system permease protein